MKLSITPVAIAVTMALGAAVAQAQTLPSYGSTAATETGLYLAVWDTNTNTTELVNLSADYAQTAYSSGTAALDSATSAYTEVANPTGASGNVMQLNLGTIAGFSSLFPSAQTSSTDYVIVSGNNNLAGFITSEAVGAGIPLTAAAVKTVAASMTGEEAEWVSVANTSPISDTTGTASFSVANSLNGSLGAGDEGLAGDQFGATLGTAANFFNDVSSGRPAVLTTNEYGNAQGAGFWFLSATGDLSWNLLAAPTSTVPLPPAVWLFASGLIGLGLIGRRRERDLGATA